jgi:hypothetical protein
LKSTGKASGTRILRIRLKEFLMPIEFNIAEDFATILDGAESITLKRRASATTIAVPTAWRFSSIAGAAEPGVADVVQSDVVWQFPWPAAEEKPHVGDLLIDAADDGWTILSVEVRGNHSRLRCVARNLRIAQELNNRVDIQQAIWEDSGSGPEIVGWTTLLAAVPARLQPHRTLVDATADPPTSTSTWRVLLGDDTPLDHNHRLVDPDGVAYRILEFTQSERIDVLPTAVVKEMPL